MGSEFRNNFYAFLGSEVSELGQSGSIYLPWYLSASHTTNMESENLWGLKDKAFLNIKVGYEIKGFDIYTNLNSVTDICYPCRIGKENSATATEIYLPGPPRIVGIWFQIYIQSEKIVFLTL